MILFLRKDLLRAILDGAEIEIRLNYRPAFDSETQGLSSTAFQLFEIDDMRRLVLRSVEPAQPVVIENIVTVEEPTNA